MTEPAPQAWWVYLLVSVPGERRSGAPRTYVGVTVDLQRRLSQHNGELPGGARSTRGGRPWRIARTLGPFVTRARAQQVEAQLKRRRGLSARLAFEPDAARAGDEEEPENA